MSVGDRRRASGRRSVCAPRASGRAARRAERRRAACAGAARGGQALPRGATCCTSATSRRARTSRSSGCAGTLPPGRTARALLAGNDAGNRSRLEARHATAMPRLRAHAWRRSRSRAGRPDDHARRRRAVLLRGLRPVRAQGLAHGRAVLASRAPRCPRCSGRWLSLAAARSEAWPQLLPRRARRRRRRGGGRRRPGSAGQRQPAASWRPGASAMRASASHELHDTPDHGRREQQDDREDQRPHAAAQLRHVVAEQPSAALLLLELQDARRGSDDGSGSRQTRLARGRWFRATDLDDFVGELDDGSPRWRCGRWRRWRCRRWRRGPWRHRLLRRLHRTRWWRSGRRRARSCGRQRGDRLRSRRFQRSAVAESLPNKSLSSSTTCFAAAPAARVTPGGAPSRYVMIVLPICT